MSQLRDMTVITRMKHLKVKDDLIICEAEAQVVPLVAGAIGTIYNNRPASHDTLGYVRPLGVRKLRYCLE